MTESWKCFLQLLLLTWISFLTLVVAQDVMVGFVETSVYVTEGTGSVMLNVTLSRELAENETVDLNITTTDGTASSASPMDFNISSLMTSVSFAAGSSGNMEITIPIVDDNVLENTENFSVTLTQAETSMVNGSIILNNASVQVFIIDVDSIMVGFLQASYSVMEGDSVMICAGIFTQESIQREVELTVTRTGGSASADDYSGVGSITLQVGDSMASTSNASTMRCFNLSAVPDSSVEVKQETLELTLSSPNQLRVMVGTSNVTIVTITDQDTATVSLEVPGEVSEDVGVVTVCARISPVAMRDVSVTIATSNYSAFAPGDYTAVTSNLVILANESLICVNLTIVNDNVVENDEAFNVSLTSMDTDVMVVNGSAQVRILSDPADGVVVMLSDAQQVSEENGSVTVCVDVIQTLERDVVVSLSTVAGSATADVDYMSLSSLPITFGPGRPSQQCVNVTLTDDDCLELNETFSLQASSIDAAVMVMTTEAEVTILDSDTVTLGFVDSDPVSVREGEVAMACISNSSGCVGTTLTIDLQVMPPQKPDSPTVLPMTLMFREGDISSCVNITAPTDNRLEETEDFLLVLASANSDRVDLTPDTLNISVEDNTTVTVGLSMTMYTVEEGGTVEVCVAVVTGVLERVITVKLSTEDNTTSAMDYTPLNEDLTFDGAVANSSMCFNISTTDNDVLEEDKVFTVVLVSLEPERVAVNPNRAQVTITENDTVVIGMQRLEVNVSENDNTSVCAEIREGTLGRDVLVGVASMTVDGATSAIEGEDFTLEQNSLLFTATISNSCVEVAILSDISAEMSEMFSVVLLNSSAPAGQVVLEPNSTTLTIFDVPFIIKQPVDQFVVLGDSAQFEVIAGGFTLTYQWQRGSVLLNDSVEGVSGSTTPMLGLANVTMGDLGEYSCVVRNLFNSVTTNGAQLQELGAPVFVQEPLDLGVLNGNDVTINCAAASLDGTVNITWEARDSQGMALDLPTPTVTDMGGNVTQSTITLRNVTADQAGIYTCTAANRVTNISTEFNLSVITIVGVEDVLTSAGNDVVLFCSASGDQRLTYMWGLISNVIAGASIPFSNLTLPRLFGANTSNLTIRNISLADTFNNAASVRCVVSLFGVEIGSATGNLTIQRVVITQPPLNATFTVPNDTLTLNCTAMNPPGAPLPLQFYWVRDNAPVLEEDARIVVWSSPEDNSTSATSVLTITNITRQDLGLYLCVVTNRGSEDRIESDPATVSLLFAPVVTSISLDDGNDGLVAIVNGSFPVPVDRNDIDAIAVFEAEPIPFLFELTRINDSDRILVNNSNYSGPQLFFRATLPVLSLADSGVTFEFAAVNTLGRGSQTFTVLVQDVPGPINHSMLTNEVVSLLSVNLSWPLPPDNNAPITSYNLSYCETGRDAPTGCINFQSLKFATNMTTTSNGVVSYMWSSGLEFNSGFAVNVTAENALGMGEALNGPAHVLTATPDDAKPVGVQISVLTDTFSIIDWSLPTVAQAEGVVVQQFNVTYDAIGSGNQTIGNVVSNLSTPFSDRVDGGAFIFGRDYNVSIVAIYTAPSAASDPTFFNFTVPTIDNVMPIFDEMPMTVGTLGPNTLTLNWPLPPPNRFLTRYDLDVTISPLLSNSRRRRRQTSLTTIAIDDLNTRSANVPVQPYSSVTVQVFAVYKPDMSRAPLTQLISVQTIQDRPTEPMIMMFTQKGLFMLLLEWIPPLEPKGVIQEYQVTYSEEGQPGLSIKVMEPGVTKYIITNLNANTLYVATVLAVTMAGAGPSSGESRARTDFGVTTPLTVNVVAGINKGRYFVSIVLRDNLGPIKRYQIIVSNTKLENTVRFGDIRPYRSTSGLYVIRAMDRSAGSFTVEIGTGVSFTNQGVMYPDKVFESNTEYYIFVRAFSDVKDGGEATRYNDSALFGPISFKPDLNTALVIAPIAAVAILLIIILVALLVVAYCTMAPCKPKNGYILPGGDVEKRSKKGSGTTAMELRRTRLFSPVLNVGTADVFTSAGQPTTLICEASGTPAPVVMWSRNGEPLDKERFIQLADGSLFVNDTDLQDEGTYMVKATNTAGGADSQVRVTVLRPMPPETDTEHPVIKVGEFSEKIALVRAEDDEGLEDEYTDVELDWTFTSYAAKMNINKNKNRYINIIPYDHSRVVLSLQDNTPGSDYINASFIDAFQRPNGYIASQGPIPSTFPDFWRMVWELDSPTIVMVTNLKEEDKIKCHQYWPSYGTTTYGNIQVTLKEVENLAEYSIRTFNVSPLAGQSRLQMPVREVRQFHFLVWPDHGVPLYATNLLSFRKRIVKYHSEKRGPMVVHCSAGVGRTGTFITIDYMLKQMDMEGTIDIFNFVRHMRYRRNYMVQTSPQYVFIHDALLESIMCGDSSIKAPELRAKVKQMCEIVPETQISVFDSQFDTLKAASPPSADFDCSIAQLPDNMSKNRSSMNLPANDYRVVLSSEKDQSDYICASYVDNYRERNAFIVTQAPLDHTVGDMWRMIWETKSAAIVMLTELIEDDKEMCVKYWPSATAEPSVYGMYQVELSEEGKDRGDYITRRFKLSPVDKPQESRMVSQFHFVRWTKVMPPKDCRPMIDLIDELQRVQRKSGNMPITVHCDDGVGRTGAFCALYSVLERVKTEQIVDVFQAVKTLRIQRTGLLSTIMEYEFVHHAVIEFLDTFSGYQNFK